MNILIPLLLILAAPAPTPRSKVVHFKRITEPREGAFTLLAPRDWQVMGGITRVDPNASGGALNSIGAKLDMTLASPDGRITLRWYPETMFVDPRRMPAAGMFPPGSNYNGALVLPLPNAFGYIEQGFRYIHTQAGNVQTKGRYPLPKVAQAYSKVTQQMGIPIAFRFDVGLMVLTYQEGGVAWEEVFFAVIQDFGDMGSGLWNNKDCFSVRAPLGELDKTGPLVSIVLNSFQVNPRWLMGEIQAQMQRGGIALRAQQDIAKLDREITEHRRRTNAEINNQTFHTLMGTEEYVNPLTKKVEVGSNAWSHRWVNANGEAIYSDDANYDPKKDGLSGFERSAVRKRFPSR
jgi:hypothetical protein